MIEPLNEISIGRTEINGQSTFSYLTKDGVQEIADKLNEAIAEINALGEKQDKHIEQTKEIGSIIKEYGYIVKDQAYDIEALRKDMEYCKARLSTDMTAIHALGKAALKDQPIDEDKLPTVDFENLVPYKPDQPKTGNWGTNRTPVGAYKSEAKKQEYGNDSHRNSQRRIMTDSLDEQIKRAIIKDFHNLYTKVFTTDWREQRTLRDCEIEVMELDAIKALILQREAELLERFTNDFIQLEQITEKIKTEFIRHRAELERRHDE